MDARRQHGSSGGFFLGIIIGVVLTLLFTTKRGRKILKVLTDKGLDKISSVDELFADEYLDDDDGVDYVKDVPSEEEQPKTKVKAHKPRLFRGAPKRSVAYKN